MRAAGAGLGTLRLTFFFEGRAVRARPGETIAAALIASGEQAFRETRGGELRGLFCGMGACQECLVEIEGAGVRRACMTKAGADQRVLRLREPVDVVTGAPLRQEPSAPIETDILVIGAGAAGLAAAAAAGEMGAGVLIADERPAPGGQYYKQPVAGSGFAQSFDDPQFAAGRALIERAEARRLDGAVRVLSEAAVIGVFEPLEVLLATPEGPLLVRPDRLIVATGAYERGLPVPGWTLPGVMTTGAAQTLLRSYRVLPGKRILVAGNGPLNWQVAVELKRAGAEIVALAEAAASPGPAALGALLEMARGTPGLLRQGLRLGDQARRLGIPLLRPRVLAGIEQTGSGLLASLASVTGPAEQLEADTVLMGYGFQPQNEILRALGCRHDFDPVRGHLATVKDERCRTSLKSVYAAGDCTGLGGAPAAEAEGLIAGHAAAVSLGQLASPALEREVARALRALRGHRRFQRGLWRLFGAALPLNAQARPDTIVCRCESVTLGEIDAVTRGGEAPPGSIKRQTRAGMGRCQGRYCGPVITDLIARRSGTPPDELSFWAPRPPAKPITIAEIASLRLPEDITP